MAEVKLARTKVGRERMVGAASAATSTDDELGNRSVPATIAATRLFGEK